tara:strand:- start:1147 stop:1449 length:303 start_codon:yes stop_codon:yes gene_type:complete
MIISLVEVFENTRVHSNQRSRSFDLREVFINPEQVVCLREDTQYNSLLVENKLPSGINKEQRFTRIHLNRGQSGIDVVVVGSPSQIQKKIFTSELKVLKD